MAGDLFFQFDGITPLPSGNEVSVTPPVARGNSPFDAIRRLRPDGSEFWSARDAMKYLGYNDWRNFVDAIDRAKLSVRGTDLRVESHFGNATKSSPMPNGGFREVPDFHLSRHAMHLVAQNSDGSKREVAAAQLYFSVQTYRAEQMLPPIDGPINAPTATLDADIARLFHKQIGAILDSVDAIKATVADQGRQLTAIRSELVAAEDQLGAVIDTAVSNIRAETEERFGQVWCSIARLNQLPTPADRPTKFNAERLKDLLRGVLHDPAWRRMPVNKLKTSLNINSWSTADKYRTLVLRELGFDDGSDDMPLYPDSGPKLSIVPAPSVNRMA